MAAVRIRTCIVTTPALLLTLALCGAAGPTAPAMASPGDHASAERTPAEHNRATPTDGSIAVTSESEAYCDRLSNALRTRMQTPHAIPFGAMQDARRLYETGTKLCRGPHLRVGIERLRRALVLLNHSQDHS